MKICPRCQKTYADDNLNFCLEDGSVLTHASSEPQTVFVNEPRPTQPQPQVLSQPGSQPNWNTPQNSPQQYSMQPPKKSSKMWIWVLLILGVIAVVCGGGLVGLIYICSQADKAANVAINNNNGKTPPLVSNSNKAPSANNFSNSTTPPPPSTASRTDLDTVDLSQWVKEFSAYGVTEFTNGEFIMSSKKKGFYYVLVAPDVYQTEKTDTRVTLRNIDNANGTLGYGLIFHSNPTPLEQDYAFLIDSKRKKYRVVSHTPSNEKSIVTWTASTAIKEGVEPNVLEARDQDGSIDLYINDTKVTTIKNVYGYAGGVAGLYSGDGVRIAFKNLEIRK
ncbi:hypothetical protein BH10ACI2_BH10ACI2_05200 [soil metagenome]